MSSSPLTPRRNSPLHRAGLPLAERQPPARRSPASEQQGSLGEGAAQPLSAGAHKARSRSLSYPQPKLLLDPQRPAPFPFTPASSLEHVVCFCPSLAWAVPPLQGVALVLYIVVANTIFPLIATCSRAMCPVLDRRPVHGSMVQERQAAIRVHLGAGGCRAPALAALTQHLAAHRAMTPLRARMSSAGSANNWCLQRTIANTNCTGQPLPT